LTPAASGKEEVSTVSNAHESRASKRMEEAVNQVSTPNTPSLPLSVSVNPLGSPTDSFSGRKEKVFQGVSSGVGDLFGAIREFLESKGIEVYRMQVGQEVYQVEHNGQVIRLYVLRNKWQK